MNNIDGALFHVFARQITDALALYYEDEGVYPDSLDELVDRARSRSWRAPS